MDSSGRPRLFEVVRFVANPGAGGFIDIAHDAQKLIFAGTFTTGGLSVSFDGKSSLVRWLRSHNGTVVRHQVKSASRTIR
jgi:acyl CoA:acetate/3-ketoacid CoA transferase